jgi:DNA-binding NtrC family response regulator
MNKILLVDDERNVHYPLQRALGEAFRIISAFSGEEALQRLSSEKPHLIPVDVKLPGADGLETLQHIKAVDREVPVILLTAYGTTETAITAMKHGAYDYLLKPVDIASLRGIMTKALHLRPDKWTPSRYPSRPRRRPSWGAAWRCKTCIR